ncbi:hypothetical protein CGRA01v4_04414 [Colletotrichum graminicola]|nr:hypothetical protein CGRA01v4_04414 [Colletotrichum graminicola]
MSDTNCPVVSSITDTSISGRDVTLTPLFHTHTHTHSLLAAETSHSLIDVSILSLFSHTSTLGGRDVTLNLDVSLHTHYVSSHSLSLSLSAAEMSTLLTSRKFYTHSHINSWRQRFLNLDISTHTLSHQLLAAETSTLLASHNTLQVSSLATT